MRRWDGYGWYVVLTVFCAVISRSWAINEVFVWILYEKVFADDFFVLCREVEGRVILFSGSFIVNRIHQVTVGLTVQNHSKSGTRILTFCWENSLEFSSYTFQKFIQQGHQDVENLSVDSFNTQRHVSRWPFLMCYNLKIQLWWKSVWF